MCSELEGLTTSFKHDWSEETTDNAGQRREKATKTYEKLKLIPTTIHMASFIKTDKKTVLRYCSWIFFTAEKPGSKFSKFSRKILGRFHILGKS